MKKIIYGLVAGVLFAFTGIAFADYTIKDGGGSTQTVLAFVCATTKICPAHVLIKSDGTEIGTNAAPVYFDMASSGNMATAMANGTGTHDSAVGSTVLQEGCKALTSEPTAVANADATHAACDSVGKRITLPYANPENSLVGLITTAMTGTTDTAVTGMGAQGAGVRNYLTQCTVSNSHASVGTDIVLKDGSGGSVLWTFPAAANYGGAVVPFPTPIKTTANTALYAANITTGASTKLSCTGYKGV